MTLACRHSDVQPKLVAYVKFLTYTNVYQCHENLHPENLALLCLSAHIFVTADTEPLAFGI